MSVIFCFMAAPSTACCSHHLVRVPRVTRWPVAEITFVGDNYRYLPFAGLALGFLLSGSGEAVNAAAIRRRPSRGCVHRIPVSRALHSNLGEFLELAHASETDFCQGEFNATPIHFDHCSLTGVTHANEVTD